MRNGWRKLFVHAYLALSGLLFNAAPGWARDDVDPDPLIPVRLTVELSWTSPPDAKARLGLDPAQQVQLGLTEGQIVEALTWPDPAIEPPALIDPAQPGGNWRLGAVDEGKIRARIEAPIHASIRVEVAGQVHLFPILDLLDGPQRSGTESFPAFEVRRLPWDVLETRLEPGNGTVAPGALVPVTVGFNVLTPEPTEVEMRLSATLRPLRGGEVLWRADRRMIVPTNAGAAQSGILLPVTVPSVEGTYTMELEATWTPVDPQRETTLLGRWWRRRTNSNGTSAKRQISLAVVGPGAPSRRAPILANGRSETLVDTVELGKARGLRPLANGHNPLIEPGKLDWLIPETVFVEPQRRDRLWNLISRVGSDPEPLGAANGNGLAWTATALRVARPGRPHRLRLTVLGGDPSALALALVVPGQRPRILLDARGSGPLIPEGSQPKVLSWPIWPDANEPILILVNRSPDRPLWLGDAQLVELADEPAPLPLNEPADGSGRRLGLLLTGPSALDRFGGANDRGPADALARARHLVAYLAHVGASSVTFPPCVPDRPRRSALEGQAGEDPIGPDRLDLILDQLHRQGMTAWMEVRTEGPLPGLAAPSHPEALAQGLVRLDRQGKPDGSAYNLLAPEVQKALTRHVLSALDRGPGRPRPDGLLIRIGPGPTLAGRPDTGLDDQTYARFVREAIQGGEAPGLDKNDPNRFSARHRFLSGPGLVPWLDWRSNQLGTFYAGLARALRDKASGTILALATPGLDDGPAGAEARRCDLAGLSPSQAWRAVGLDLNEWPNEPNLLVLRGAELSTGDLAHDLATRRELDEQVLTRSARGLLLGVGEGLSSLAESENQQSTPLLLRAVPLAPGPDGDEPLGHALAALDAGWVLVSASATAGQEERLRGYARIFRALPTPTNSRPIPLPPSGVAVRSWTVANSTYLAMANDTPYPLLLQAVLDASAPVPVEDLGRGFRLRHDPAPGGGKLLVMELAPFGVSALRIGAPGVRIRSTTPHFSDHKEADREAVVDRLRRLSQGEGLRLPNTDFEPSTTTETGEVAAAGSLQPPSGWHTESNPDSTLTLDLDQPRSGLASLRLDLKNSPGSVYSDPFTPPAGAISLRAWFRTDPPDAPIRVRIEGEPGTPAESLRLLADLPAKDRRQWTTESLQAADLPGSPAALVRLRFELLTPGRLWIDDLSVQGPGLLHARSCLTAALQAYGEGRYSDFARLSKSHWARRLTTLEDSPIQTGEVPNDLPSRPRLR